MSNVEEAQETEADARERPAIAVFAGGESDAVVGTILRARERDHEVFVLVRDPDSEAARHARELGAQVVSPEIRTSNGDRLEYLRRVARQQGFPGVIYHEDPTARIDYDRSTRALWESDEYVVDAEIEATVAGVPEVLVAIPAYNEAGTVGEVVRDASVHADEVVVIDDGSEDDTVQEARAAGATVVEHERNKGYGAALKTAFQEAERSGAEHLVILDGDGQHDAGDVSRLVDHQRDTGAEVVVGCRFGEEAETDLPLYRWVGLTVVNVLTNLSLGVVRPSSRVRDTQSGFRCYSRAAIETLAEDDSIGDHMGASTDILHHAHTEGYEIDEVGTTVRYDVGDTSSQNPLQHGLTLVSNLLRTIEHERPILILGVPGFLLAALGIGFGYWTFSTYLDAGTFPVGLAVTSVFFTLAGVFTGFTAIILHALKTHLGDLKGANGG